MKVDDIMIGKQISPHLHKYDMEISPEDLLKIIRLSARKGRGLGSVYNRPGLCFTNSNAITRKEFDIIYEQPHNQPDYLLDKYVRDDLVDKVSSDIRIISSTTKTEIIQKILRNRNLVFKHFKKDVVEKYSTNWHDFKRGKMMLPAISDPSKRLVFTLGSKPNKLSKSQYLQYWSLGSDYTEYDLTEICKTEIINDSLIMNLKDSDDMLLKALYKFEHAGGKTDKLQLKCLTKRIFDESLDLRKANGITYQTGLFDLVDHFGVRKVSKLKTFCEGLKQRQDKGVLPNCLGRKFLITTKDNPIYTGVDFCQELFEMIAWHLKIEYMNEGQILCKVVQDETPETIIALWDLLTSNRVSGWFYFIETENASDDTFFDCGDQRS
ncbi:MAG: hypothetical protein JXB24_10330 [Bacteroidales bacterium]|nr:hypothetical protein [Bacteroidales bacterium]